MSAISDTYRSKYQSVADAAAQSNGIPTGIFSSLVSTESNWNPYAVSSAGAVGLGQLMPGTAKNLGVNAWNPSENITGSASFLATLYKKFGNWRDALAGYNAGPGNIKAGYGYADKVLANSGYALDPMGNPIPDASGAAQERAATDAATAPDSSFVTDWIIATVKRAGFLILALLLLAFGIWAMIANKESGARA